MAIRNVLIDRLKGFCILLVIIGHLIQMKISPTRYNENLFFQIIYSFHMPLFFLLAGSVFKLRSWSDELFLSFKRLIIPFFTFYFIVSCDLDLRIFLSKIIDYLINPQLGFWFLFVLAGIRISFSFLWPMNSYLRFMALLLYLVVGVLFKKMFAMDYILFYAPFFAAGFLIKNHTSPIIHKLGKYFFNRDFLGVAILLLIILSYTCMFRFYHRNIEGVSLIEFLLQKYLLAIFAISIAYKIFLIGCFDWANKILELVGIHTLFIYGLHLLFIGSFYYFGFLSIIPMVFIPILLEKIFHFSLNKIGYLKRNVY
jgi:fucose 4-O-acetylase-like acetyltransferase